ncbi:hypothetical protein SAMN03159362_5474 [Pseudomonas sp. NFIX51]|nr:hypothetical protein C4K25_3697 [Pseudomonas chlororaphis]SEM20894.1 hypothetical protein SAMN03159414_4602 [Pseudomonas sp. NFACC41-3]SMH61501.1 hypothetical protein SAMN03159362_5474 [Pseudomonas sp. NFIX51]
METVRKFLFDTRRSERAAIRLTRDGDDAVYRCTAFSFIAGKLRSYRG